MLFNYHFLVLRISSASLQAQIWKWTRGGVGTCHPSCNLSAGHGLDLGRVWSQVSILKADLVKIGARHHIAAKISTIQLHQRLVDEHKRGGNCAYGFEMGRRGRLSKHARAPTSCSCSPTLVASSGRANCTNIRTASCGGKLGSVTSNMSTLRKGRGDEYKSLSARGIQ